MVSALFDSVATGLSMSAGTAIQLGFWTPTAPATSTLISEKVGLQRDPYNLNFQQHRIQVLSRAMDYNVARAREQTVLDYIIPLRGVQLSGWYLYDVVGGVPAYIGPDKKGRHVFSANLTVTARKE